MWIHRAIALAAAISAAVVVLAVPAWAAPSFDKATVAAGAREEIALKVPGEAGTATKKVLIHLAQGFVVDKCVGRDGWRCKVTLATQPSRTNVTWEWAAVAVAPTSDVVHFTVRPPRQGGAYRVEVDQFYADGHVVYWGASSSKLAPTLTVEVASTTTTVGVAHNGPAVTHNRYAATAAKKKESNVTALYIVIALWLAVVIPVLIAGMKDPQHDDAHPPDRH